MREKLNADFLSAQRQWERYSEETRLKHEQELSKLRQQVYILEAKVCMCLLREYGMLTLELSSCYGSIPNDGHLSQSDNF